MTKAQLRPLYRRQRQALSKTEWSERCDGIATLFFNFWPNSTVGYRLHTFLPIENNREIDTWRIVRRLWQDFPAVQVAAPVTDLAAGTMTNYLIDPTTDFTYNRYGIPEPPSSNPSSAIPDSSIDLILVPLLAFDQQGNRVGYGGGYYDRFLAQCRPDCQKVGLSLFEPVETIGDCYEGDIRLDACLTPFRTYRF